MYHYQNHLTKNNPVRGQNKNLGILEGWSPFQRMKSMKIDEDVWNKKVYGRDVIVVDTCFVPKAIFADGNVSCVDRFLMIDSSAPSTKIKNVDLDVNLNKA